MRTTADPFLGSQTHKQKKGLKEILKENDLYEDVISQITQRLALRDAISKASHAIDESKKSQKEQASECGSVVTTLSKAERMINTFD